MRSSIETALASKLEPALVRDLLDGYQDMIAEQRLGDHKATLMHAGRFVEHLFRLIIWIQTGKLVAEVKSVAAAVASIENDTTLPEPIRLVVPRVAYGMIYNMRSKRNAVHVKEIDPSSIDTSLAISAASWIVAELLRLYHNLPDVEVVRLLTSLLRAKLPLVEIIDEEIFVTRKVPGTIEVLLLLGHAMPSGLARLDLGRMAKCSPSSVTRSLQSLESDRLVHKTAAARFFLTASGEAFLADWLSANSNP